MLGGVSSQHLLAAELGGVVNALAPVDGRVFAQKLLGIFADVKRLGAGVEQAAHAGKPRRLGDVDRGDQIDLKPGVDVLDVGFAHGRREVNHALGANFLKGIDERRQIADVAVDDRDLFAGYPADVVRPRREIEKRHIIAALEQLFCSVGADHAGSGD